MYDKPQIPRRASHEQSINTQLDNPVHRSHPPNSTQIQSQVTDHPPHRSRESNPPLPHLSNPTPITSSTALTQPHPLGAPTVHHDPPAHSLNPLNQPSPHSLARSRPSHFQRPSTPDLITPSHSKQTRHPPQTRSTGFAPIRSLDAPSRSGGGTNGTCAKKAPRVVSRCDGAE